MQWVLHVYSFTELQDGGKQCISEARKIGIPVKTGEITCLSITAAEWNEINCLSLKQLGIILPEILKQECQERAIICERFAGVLSALLIAHIKDTC